MALATHNVTAEAERLRVHVRSWLRAACSKPPCAAAASAPPPRARLDASLRGRRRSRRCHPFQSAARSHSPEMPRCPLPNASSSPAAPCAALCVRPAGAEPGAEQGGPPGAAEPAGRLAPGYEQATCTTGAGYLLLAQGAALAAGEERSRLCLPCSLWVRTRRCASSRFCC